MLVDARCLQDPDFAGRGIGRHAASLLAHAPRGAGTRLVGLIDRALPPPEPALFDTLFDALRPNSYTGAMRRPACLVQPSPMTHDPLFVARLLAHPGVPCATVVHDFIPHDEPDRYLGTPDRRLAHDAALQFLPRYDLFLPNSAATARRLREIFELPDERIAVTGSPLDPAFATLRDAGEAGGAAHVLVVGGDWRKNPECVVRAHAAAARLQLRDVPLVLTGGYAVAHDAELRGLARAAGGDPALLRTVADLPPQELQALVRDALLVVLPSRAEGFSLPVIEAMAAGVPVLASRIPAHEELVGDPDLLFAPEDHATLAAAMDRLADDADARAAIVARQDLVWPRFSARAVAGRFWSALAPLLTGLDAPAVLRGARPRIALLTPVPPTLSGISDASAGLLPALGALADVHVFTDTRAPLPLPGAAAVLPNSTRPHVGDGFDRVVAVLGNAPLHQQIMDMLERFGGAAIAHDARMIDFYWHRRGAQPTAEMASRELGRLVETRDIVHWLAHPGLMEAMFLGEIVQIAEPLCVHAAATARLIAARYGVTPAHLPFSMQRGFPAGALTDAARAAARARLGLDPAQVVIATFGWVHHTKAPEDCVWVLDLLRLWHYDATLVFVGAQEGDGVPLQKMVAELGLQEHVRLPQRFIAEADYRDWLLAADLALQLRTLTLGSVSGALMDCIGAGLPGVANADLADALDAPSFVARVPDRFSPLLVAERLAGLIDARPGRAGLEDERAGYVAAHAPEAYARHLLAALGIG